MSDPIEPMTDTPEKIARLRLAGHKAPIKTYERPLISNFTDPIYDDARTHEVVDSKEI